MHVFKWDEFQGQSHRWVGGFLYSWKLKPWPYITWLTCKGSNMCGLKSIHGAWWCHWEFSRPKVLRVSEPGIYSRKYLRKISLLIPLKKGSVLAQFPKFLWSLGPVPLGLWWDSHGWSDWGGNMLRSWSPEIRKERGTVQEPVPVMT